ncbi:hypothetical protein [Pseudoalteromonas sp. ZZD1]
MIFDNDTTGIVHIDKARFTATESHVVALIAKMDDSVAVIN